MKSEPAMSLVNILVVDDRVENRTAMRAILASPEYHVVEASSSADALLRLLETEFALLLIDVVMPDMDGFELAKAIKERERTASVPIVFLTAQATDVARVYDGYRVGAVDYLIKPLVPEVVRAKVAVFAELFQQRKRLLAAEHRESEGRIVELELAAQRRYRALADAVPHIVWTAHPDGVVDYLNQRWFEYTGRSLKEAGGSWEGAVHPDDLPRCQRRWRDALDTGQMFEAECRLSRAVDGSARWHLVRAVPERSTSGQIVSWLGTFTDIEDQKRAQAALTEFKATLDAEPDAVLMFETRGWRLVYVNQGAAVLLGTPRDELLQMRAIDFTAEHDEARLREVLAPLSEGARTSILIETMFRRRGIGAVPFDVSVQLIRIGEDRLVAIARDISERKRVQLEREILYREAVDAIRARDEFLSIASHELRTPLSALKLQLQLLRQHAAAQVELLPKLQMAERQVERLSSFVSELLDVSRIRAGRLRLELESLDLAALVQDVLGRLAVEAERARCPIELSAPAPVLGSWDRMRIEQVVMNLMTNAFKFGAGQPIEVTVEAKASLGSLTVVDHGIGIPTEDIERIFERYEQAIATRKYGGLGLGLYIVRQIVEAHGGTIRVESRPGAGATFVVELPVQPAPAMEEPRIGTLAEAEAPSTER
jgi:PAS domain S-box-containing protein